MLLLDSGGVTALAESSGAIARVRAFNRQRLWPPTVPTIVLVECLTGHPGRDARVNRLLRRCELIDTLPYDIARRAAALRTVARRGSAVDAVLVALAERAGGSIMTGDLKDLRALAQYADGVVVESV